jgi:hypothetical protein
LADAKRLAHRSGSAIRAITESDEQWLRVEFRIGSPLVEETPQGAPGRYVDLLASAFGGTVSRKPGGVELRMPTLKARRAAGRQ